MTSALYQKNSYRVITMLLILMIVAGMGLFVQADNQSATEPKPFHMAGKQMVVSVTKQEIWVRSGPGFTYPVIGKLSACGELKVLEKGIWYKIQEGDLEGYVYGSTFNSADEYVPGRLNGSVIGLDPDGQVVMDNSLEPISPWSQVTKPKMEERIFGVNSETPDYQVNLQITKALKRLLELEGATVIMTKTDADSNLSNAQRAQYLCGTAASNSVRCYLALRIGCNQSVSPESRGTTAFLQKNTMTRYAALAEHILANITHVTGMPTIPPVETDSDTFLNWSDVAAISIELGYLTNTLDEKILVDPLYQTMIADAIRDAVVQYVETLD